MYGCAVVGFRDGIVHAPHLARTIIIYKLYGCACVLNAVVAGGGNKVPVVELPVHGGPCAVEHPVHYTGGLLVYVAAEGLVHGTRGVVVKGVRLLDIVFKGRGLPVGAVHHVHLEVHVVHMGR